MAKTYKNIYPRIYDFSALHAAFRRARKGHRTCREIMRFEQNLEGNLIQIQNELIWGTYRTGEYRYFEIHEPKKRLVAALPFRDRVVQHALVAAIEPIWEKRFISDSYACRVGRGMHSGANQAQRFLRQVKRKHGKVYVFKADVAKYFANIDHSVLEGLLKKHIACRKTLALVSEIITSSGGKVGIPIGNLTSQLFANIYLHELDLFIKNILREPRYIRYMDDTVIVHHNKRHLKEVRIQTESFLEDTLKLKTNSKSQIYPVAMFCGRPLDFLGYRIWPTHRLLRKSSVNRMRRALKTMVNQYAKNSISTDKIKRRIASWLGHAKHADSFNIRTKLLKQTIFRRTSL